MSRPHAKPPPVHDPPAADDRSAQDRPPQSPDAGAVVRFEDLAGTGSEVLIEHAGRVYRLRRTRRGKLLLNR